MKPALFALFALVFAVATASLYAWLCFLAAVVWCVGLDIARTIAHDQHTPIGVGEIEE